MKKKLFYISFALVFVLALTLVPATAAVAVPADVESAIIAAADRLEDVQNTDGGFPWLLPGTTSATNVTGVTAMGILKAYAYNDKYKYRVALGEAYKYIDDNAPGFTWDVGDAEYNETTKGCDSFPDITFLVELADAAESDSALLSAIAGVVPGTTAADIAALAKARWDTRIETYGSSTQTPLDGTATSTVERIRDVRSAQGYPGLTVWDPALGVEAALALDSAYPGEGYDVQASDIATVIYLTVDNLTYFSSTDTTQKDYVLGLTGAIWTYAKLGIHPAELADLTAKLLAVQQTNGSWMWYSSDPPVPMSIQSTAYAVMALMEEGSNASINAVKKSVDWLVSSQKGDGGWYSENGAGGEYAEVDAEAACALARYLGSGSVNLTVNIPDIVAISVDPGSIDYGTLRPGETSAQHVISVTNIGTNVVNVDAYLTSVGTVFDNLQIYYDPAGGSSPAWQTPVVVVVPDFDDYVINDLAINTQENRTTRLVVPPSYSPGGPEAAQLVFEATAP